MKPSTGWSIPLLRSKWLFPEVFSTTCRSGLPTIIRLPDSPRTRSFLLRDGPGNKTQIAPDKKTPGKLLICDLPATLTAVFDAIEMYLSKGHIGKSKEQELIEARELSNFVAVVKAKVAEDPFNNKLVRFIEE